MIRLDEGQKRQVRELLAELVAIDSAILSPEQATRDRTEEKVAAYLTDRLVRMGMVVERQEVFPGRPNLMAHWPGQGAGRSLMLEAHMDTVTVEGMTVDPFAAEVRDGRMYGRGTCDTKGSIAAFLTALQIARETGRLPSDKLWFVATMSEETGCDGAVALMRHGFRSDAAIVGEPTRCQVVTAHKAPLWIHVELLGRSCHASMPEHGVNAVDRAARAIRFLHGPWADRVRRVSHPLLGRSTMTATRIEGGLKINIIPASCRVEIDGRLVPGQQAEGLLAEFRRMLAAELGGEDAFRITHVKTLGPLDCPADTPVAARLLEVCREYNGQESPCGVNYFADTGPFNDAGIRAVLFGPGDIEQAHTADEFLELDQLYQATEILLAFLIGHAGRSVVE